MLCNRQMFSGRLHFSLRTKNVLVQAAFQPLPFPNDFSNFTETFESLWKRIYTSWCCIWYPVCLLFLISFLFMDFWLIPSGSDICNLVLFFFFFHVLWLALSKCQCLGDLQCFLIFFLLCFLLLLCSPPTMTKKCLTLCSALALSIAKICGFMGTECCFQTIFFVLSMIDFSWVRYLMRTLAGKHLLSSPLCVSLLFSNTEAQPPKLVILDSRNQFWI